MDIGISHLKLWILYVHSNINECEKTITAFEDWATWVVSPYKNLDIVKIKCYYISAIPWMKMFGT